MAQIEIQGIDISHWQGKIDFSKVKAAGKEFVIIKAGGSDNGRYTDSMFSEYYDAAIKAGLHVGAYYFTGRNFYNVESGIADAEHFIKILNGRKFDFPVWCDIEATQPGRRDDATAAAIAFCDRLEQSRYFAGIYASVISGFKSRLDHDKLTKYAHWAAQYGKKCKDADAQMWQYSSTGKVDGISPRVDLDISYVSYPDIIIKKGLNNYTKKRSGAT